MTNIFRGTSKTSQYILITQFILGLVSLCYFISYGYFLNVLYAFIAAYVMIQVLHNIGLHRYFAHNSFTTTKFWHIFLCVSTPLLCAGSPFGYAMAHRAHHINSDTVKDPHYKDIGYFNVFFFNWNLAKVPIRVMSKLNEQWIMIGHNYYLLIILVTYGMLICVDIEYGMIYNTSIFFVSFMLFAINSLSHMDSPMSYRNFDTPDKSTNDLITGFVVGEWHNNHHKNPQHWNQRVNWWEVDVSAQLVKLIKK